MTDEERDAHLRAALRHAPDAQLQPPPALSELILKEARAKARVASTPVRSPHRPLLSVWDWLARPSVATGFAGVMVATLIGLMWWDQPMDEAMPRPPAPAPAPAAAPAPTPVQVVPPPPPAPIAEAARPAPTPQPTQAPQRKSVPAAKPAPPAAPAPELAAREEVAAPNALGAAQPAREAPPPVALSAPPPAPAPAPAAAADTAGAAATSRAKLFDESKRQRSMASADTLNKAAKTEAREAEARSSIAQLRAAIAAEPTRWAWQRGGAAAQGMNDAVYAWLAQLESATGTRWQTRAEPDTTAPLGRELRLLRDGRVLHTLRITERGVLWEGGQGSRQVELRAATLAELQAALDAAAP